MRKIFTILLLLLFVKAVSGQEDHITSGNLAYANSVSGGKNTPEKNISIENNINSVTNRLIVRNVMFNWVSEENLGCKGYYIERKSGRSKWESIAFINAKNESKNYYSYSDNNLQTGEYQYRLKQVFNNGKTAYINFDESIKVDEPKRNALSHDFPNVFNPFTTIKFQIESSELVIISIINEEGKVVEELLNEEKDAGYYELKVNTRLMKPGKYFYKIVAGDFSSVNNFSVGK